LVSSNIPEERSDVCGVKSTVVVIDGIKATDTISIYQTEAIERKSGKVEGPQKRVMMVEKKGEEENSERRK